MNEMNSIQIVPAREEHYPQVLSVFNEGFSHKFSFVTKNEKLQKDFAHDFGVFDFITQDRTFVALEGDKVLGIIILKHNLQKGTGQGHGEVSQGIVGKYGFFGLIRAIILANKLMHNPKGQELYLDSIAVSSEARGKGIGSALLDFVEAYAKERGFNRLSLYVMVENKRAMTLYERHGYRAEKLRKFRWFARRTGFSGAWFMVKEL